MLRVVVCLIFAAAWATRAGAASLDEAAERYRHDLIADIDRALSGARAMRNCIGANDLDGAKRAWIDARIGWERSEVFTAGFVPELDQQIDAWPNAVHGFHGIEAKLFGANRTDVRDEADSLITHLAELSTQVHDIRLTPQGLLNGIVRLAYEIGGSKADGGESRVSGTSLNDMQSNAEGIDLAYRVIFLDAIKASDGQLAAAAQAAVQRITTDVKIPNLRTLDAEKLRTDSEMLVALLQSAGPKIGLNSPTLEEAAR